MAEGLFITRADLVKFTAVSANLDTDKFIQFVKIAQDVHIKAYLGTDLFDKIQTLIQDGALAGVYLTLVEKYIKPMLIHFALMEALPFLGYTIANNGISKPTSENSSSATKEEVDFLVEKQRKIAEYYTERFINHMSFNASSKYPEYHSNANEAVFPFKKSKFSGWVL